ncbi:MAG: DUF86 domain-containing protein [Deltaproteobacteria bacterium]|nr:DUF86 domain-containing protein [Deltaproteobacteria bacterium]
MSVRDDVVSLKDMLDHAREAVELLGDMGRENLAENRVMQLALTRLIEIIGEAANRVSKTTQEKHRDVAWSQIIGMRNRLIHGYDVIDYEMLYDTVTADLPPLIAVLERILGGTG